MDLRFTETQEILKKMAQDFLTTECPKPLVRKLEQSEEGYSPEVWKKMAELGWMGLIIPEEYGGMGYTFQDLVVLLEEIGRNILPGPLIATVTSTFPVLEAALFWRRNCLRRRRRSALESLLPAVAASYSSTECTSGEPSARLDSPSRSLRRGRATGCALPDSLPERPRALPVEAAEPPLAARVVSLLKPFLASENLPWAPRRTYRA